MISKIIAAAAIAAAAAALSTPGTAAAEEAGLSAGHELAADCSTLDLVFVNETTQDHRARYRTTDGNSEKLVPAGETATVSQSVAPLLEEGSTEVPYSFGEEEDTHRVHDIVDLTGCDTETGDEDGEAGSDSGDDAGTGFEDGDEGSGQGTGNGDGGEDRGGTGTSDGGSNAWAEWIATLPRAPEGMKPGRFCRTEDRLVTIYAYTDTSVLQCVDRNGYRWIEFGTLEDLVPPPEDEENETGASSGEGGEKHAPGGEKADEGKDVPDASAKEAGQLPVTGPALAGPAAAAMAALIGGGAAMYLARKRAAAASGGAED
ncbi:hypothetical protein [Allosalinactinospora lopnorensis]|uniref:hypothetical protein n=1 Tax=Allosalinactinospora lopnorensis TaxID=1352348 RepID=UPI000623E9E6|nr:hypothetical protein [Allosalinactinospora lopnorensis]